MSRYAFALLAIILVFSASCGGGGDGIQDITVPASTEWELTGSEALLIGGYGDNFSYDGRNVTPVDGNVVIHVDAAADTGSLTLTFTGILTPAEGVVYEGLITVVVTNFAGYRGKWQEGGIADDLYLHGMTGHDPPVMPKMHGFLAGWNHTADVYVNGTLVYHLLDVHFMYTDGARDDVTHMVYQWDRSTPFSPMMPDDGYVDANDREIHVVVQSHFVDPNNFPPYTVFFHLNFETVDILKAPQAAPR